MENKLFCSQRTGLDPNCGQAPQHFLNFEDLEDQAPGTNEYLGTIDFRYPSFDAVDADMKPVSQMEFSLGAEKKIMENLSFTVRFSHRRLLRTIEDIGTYARSFSRKFCRSLHVC